MTMMLGAFISGLIIDILLGWFILGLIIYAKVLLPADK